MMSRRWKLLIAFAVAILLVAVTAYGAAGYLVYQKLTHVDAHCGGSFPDNTPASFDASPANAAPYLMSGYRAVQFASLDPGIAISAWYVPAPDAARAPAVVLVHGLGSCKRDPAILLPAGMLHSAGISVLMIDLRNEGDSTVYDGRYAGGTEEYRDVLAAWSWLQTAQGIPAARIGLFGTSLGAGTVMDATGEQPRVAATWEDSGFADMDSAIHDELARNGYPTFLAPAGIAMARLIGGDDLTFPSPLWAAEHLAGRPLFITHGDADERLSVRFASELAHAARAQGGGNVEVWIVPGAGHVRAMFLHPDEYNVRLVAFFSGHLGG